MKTFFASLLAVVLASSGCTTKSKARVQSQTAFTAGQQQALNQLNEARRINIRVVGPVQNPEVTWSEGLTLAKTIAAARITVRQDPKAIFIIRQGERAFVDPKWLLRGGDLPLEPGDTVEIQP